MCTFSLDTGADCNILPLSTFCTQTIKIVHYWSPVPSQWPRPAAPVIYPSRKVPLALKDQIKPAALIWVVDTEHHDKNLRQLLNRKHHSQHKWRQVEMTDTKYEWVHFECRRTEARPRKGQSNKDIWSCTNEVLRHIEVPLQDCTLKLSDVSAPLGKLLEEDSLWH